MLRAFPPKPRQNPLSDPSKFRFDGQNWISRKFGRDIMAKAKPKVLSKMVRVQEQMGKPLTITSGHRGPVTIDGKTYDHNKIAGGAPRSTHVPGMAMDVSSRNLTPNEAAKFVRTASSEGFGSIQQYPGGNFHVDIGNPRQWTTPRDPQVAQAIKAHYAGNIPPADNQPAMAQTPVMEAPPRAAVASAVPTQALGPEPVPAPSQAPAAPSQELADPEVEPDTDYKSILANALMKGTEELYRPARQQPMQTSFMVQAAQPTTLNPTPEGVDPRIALIMRALQSA